MAITTTSNSLINFKSNFKGGTRANRFGLILTFPSGAAFGDPTTKGLYNVTSASLPKSDIGVIGVPFRGRMAYFAGDRQYSVWPIKIYDDGDNANNLWKSFQKWKELLDGHSTHTVSRGDFSYKTLTKTIAVLQYGLDNTAIRTIYLNNCWPSEIGGINFDLGASDFVTFDVTLTFNNIEIIRGI